MIDNAFQIYGPDTKSRLDERRVDNQTDKWAEKTDVREQSYR